MAVISYFLQSKYTLEQLSLLGSAMISLKADLNHRRHHFCTVQLHCLIDSLRISIVISYYYYYYYDCYCYYYLLSFVIHILILGCFILTKQSFSVTGSTVPLLTKDSAVQFRQLLKDPVLSPRCPVS